ncbi:MAG TPA: ATP-binding protein [Pyrinomonadaceae bacterium]|jgi:photoactive yellow protein|nr:ATP-binding protein [Pyrinomonadaceae bacterium]
MEQLHFPTSFDQPDIDFATLDLLPYGIIVVDEQGKILYYNAREEQIAHRRREDVVGKNFFREVAPCTQVREFYGRFEEAMRSVGLVATFNFTFPFADRAREVEISLASFRKESAQLCLISVSDVTEKNLLREHIVRAERLREVGEVAAGVAHSFNNLLTVIRGNAELILMMIPEEDPVRERAARILKAADDGEEIVKRIRASAHEPHLLEEGDAPAAAAATIAAAVDLNQVVKDSIAFTEDYARATQDERGARARFETSLAEDELPVRAPASELREVFINLLRNSIDAIDGEGRIIVHSRNDLNLWNVVEVSDTGRGMDAEVQARLFHPLFTTKGARGTGLGLATSYAIVRRYGGDITVKSAPRMGSTFTVSLPVAD